ncbi:unnamed protein product [Hydatigera taeniaeformis]|uniref:Protein kinase domain-containing protein n=1 Tax=Hydatigena taeniaeformis TaxID=6205 RepID=A0A3P7E3Y7_HYDTA|nr:unnamed protein product [Hydatigera taeniaeformis]
MRPDDSSVDAEVAEEEKEEASDGCNAFSKGSGSSTTSSSSSTKGLKRSELLLEELQRREMIRFEDELHKIILIPRVYLEFDSDLAAAAGGGGNESEDKEMQRFYDYAHRDDYLYGYGSHFVRKRRDTNPTSAMLPQKVIRVPVSPESNGDSSGSAKLSYLVTGLDHFTEYLFFISACHEPHDEYGNQLSCTSTDCDLEQDAGCSQAVRISQRTQAIPHADEVPSASLYALTPLQPTTGSSQSRVDYLSDPFVNLSRSALNDSVGTSATVAQKETPASPIKLFWNEPNNPNGLILYYWLQYRRTEGASTTPEESSSLPWFTICVTPKYLEDDAAIKALAGLRCTTSLLKEEAVVIAEQVAKSEEDANLQCDSAARTVFTELGFLRAGFYEWQVMAVSLAGNGSWTKSHFFDVQVNNTLQPSHIAAILVVTLLVVGFVIAFAVWLDYRNRNRRRMNALKNRKSEYLESLLLENFQDEWEVDPKDLSYNVEDTLGQGSFGLVCRGRLARLTTPAAEYLHLTSAFTSGSSASAGGGGNGRPSSTYSTSGSKNWFTFILSRRFRRASGANGDAQGMDVAVKILSPGSTYEDVREFLGEASHMKQFNCNHIVRLLGIVSKQIAKLTYASNDFFALRYA